MSVVSLPRALLGLGLLVVLQSNTTEADKANKLSDSSTEWHTSSSINIDIPVILFTSDTLLTKNDTFPVKKLEKIQDTPNLSKSKENKPRLKENKYFNNDYKIPTNNESDIKPNGIKSYENVEVSTSKAKQKILDIAANNRISKFNGNVTLTPTKKEKDDGFQNNTYGIIKTRPNKNKDNKSISTNQNQTTVKQNNNGILSEVTLISKSKANNTWLQQAKIGELTVNESQKIMPAFVKRISKSKDIETPNLEYRNIDSVNKTQKLDTLKAKHKKIENRPNVKTDQHSVTVKHDKNSMALVIITPTYNEGDSLKHVENSDSVDQNSTIKNEMKLTQNINTSTNVNSISNTKAKETFMVENKHIPENSTHKIQSKNFNYTKMTITSDVSAYKTNITTVKQKQFTVIPTVEETIIEEEFILINDKKGKTTSETWKIDSSLTKRASKNSDALMSASHSDDSHQIKKRSPLNVQEEDIEMLDWTGPPTIASTSESTTELLTTTNVPKSTTGLSSTTRRPSTTITATNFQCTSNDYSNAKQSCNLSNYEVCNNRKCQCIPGYNWKYEKGPCKPIVIFVIVLVFDMIPSSQREMSVSSLLTTADEKFDCPPAVVNYITDVMSSSAYADFFYPGAEYQESCYNESGRMSVNFTMEFSSADVPANSSEDVLKTFETTKVNPPFIDTKLNSSESMIDNIPVASTCIDSSATRNADGVCECSKSYIDLSPTESPGMMCSKCDPDCENGGVCKAGDTTTPTVVCQCSSSMYFGESCGESYTAVIAGSVVGGVLLIAAVMTGSVIYYRNTKLKKIRKSSEDQIAADQYLENTNFRRHSSPEVPA